VPASAIRIRTLITARVESVMRRRSLVTFTAVAAMLSNTSTPGRTPSAAVSS
jgi:hypothetical protein